MAVPAIPTEESPEDCSEALRGLITPRTLVVGHSLGVMVALNHMATEFPEETRFPGLVSVAGNINNAGFEELTPHFPKYPSPLWQADRLRGRVKKLTLLYGAHDPWVSYRHGQILWMALGLDRRAPVIELQNEAHFSEELTLKDGTSIPPCNSIPLLNRIVSSMIYEENPDPRRAMVARRIMSILPKYNALPLGYDADLYYDMRLLEPED